MAGVSLHIDLLLLLMLFRFFRLFRVLILLLLLLLLLMLLLLMLMLYETAVHYAQFWFARVESAERRMLACGIGKWFSLREHIFNQ